jgi:K+-transporting ATPase ATPase C chain
MNMVKQIKTALILFGLLALITGMVYPLLITLAGQVFFPYRANGSLIDVDGKLAGSELIGQQFDDPKYFWGRPSATVQYAYNAAASGGSNLSQTNPELQKRIEERVAALRAADPQNQQAIPVDLVTASGSGLDPHISVAAAQYQVERVARERGLPAETVQNLVKTHTEGPMFGLLGETRVNVLELNLALDEIK